MMGRRRSMMAWEPKELAEEFTFQAAWRREKATEYPDDTRNLEAAALLDRLAKSVADCPPEVIEAAGELFEDSTEAEDWSEMMRQVGFHSWPKTAEEFLREFISHHV